LELENMNKEITKAKAKALQTYLESQGVTLKHSKALEAIARIEGFPSYNVLQSRSQEAEGPTAAPAVSPPVWEIDVCRLGYASTVVIVKGARTAKEAAERGLEEMNSDHFGGENHSDYFIEGKGEPDEEPEALFLENEEPGEPRTWEVAICRKSYGQQTLRINGENLTREQAEELALDEAGNHYYPPKDFEYEVTGAYPCHTNVYD
jgi:hypothetical protein